MLHTHFQRIIIYVLVSVLIFAVYTPAHANSVQLEIQGIDEKTENGSGRRLTRPIIKTFRENHPAARIVFSSQRAYKSSEQLVQALNTGKLKSDIFTLTSRMSNFHSVFGSGICMDISENKRLSESLASMFSTIGATGKLENKIYGIPIELSTLPHLYYRQEAWNAAGYSLEEIPTSYAKLLDFLEKWIERIKTHPSENICVMNAFDIENVTKGVY